MLEILTNIINGIILIATTIVITILSSQKRTDKFLNAFNKHRIRNIVLATTFFIVIVGVYASNFYLKKTGNLEQNFYEQYDKKVENIVRLKDKITQLDTENKSLQISYQLIKTRFDSVGKLIREKQNRKEDIDQQINQKETEKSRLNEQLQKEDPRNVEQINALKLKISQLESEIQKLTREREQLEKEIEKLEAEKKDLNQKNEDLKNSLANSSRERQELESRLKKEHDIYATRIAQFDSVISLLGSRQDQSKLTHQIAWSPDKKWLAILYSYGKISRLLVIDLNYRTGRLDSLLPNKYQQIKFSSDGAKIFADTDIIYLQKPTTLQLFQNPETAIPITLDKKTGDQHTLVNGNANRQNIIKQSETAPIPKITLQDSTDKPRTQSVLPPLDGTVRSHQQPIDSSDKPGTQSPQPLLVRSVHFRQNPTNLSEEEVQKILKKFDFYCADHNLSKAYCNPNGRGFNNAYQTVTIHDDKVVIDSVSGTMWQQSGSEKSMLYADAEKWIEDLNQQGYAGFNDWRLPTLEEAMALMESKEINNNFYIDPVFDKTKWMIWTADELNGSLHWYVSFLHGRCGWHQVGGGNFVRAVRSGQSSQK